MDFEKAYRRLIADLNDGLQTYRSPLPQDRQTRSETELYGDYVHTYQIVREAWQVLCAHDMREQGCPTCCGNGVEVSGGPCSDCQ